MLYLVKDDIGTQIRATLTREHDGSVVDLSSATTVLKFRKKGTTSVLASLTSSATTGQKANGIAIFSFTAAALANAEGKYEGEIEVTFSGGTVETVFEVEDFYLRDDF
jgi:hypothetical protein